MLELQYRRKEENFYYISTQNRHANEIETHLFPAHCVLYRNTILPGNRCFVIFAGPRKKEKRDIQPVVEKKTSCKIIEEEEQEEEEKEQYSEESEGLIWGEVLLLAVQSSLCGWKELNLLLSLAASS